MRPILSTLARIGLAVLVLLSIPLGAASAQQEGAQVRITQVDTSRFPQVTVYVSVTDAQGEPLGIEPGRIVIYENGVPMPLNQVSGVGEQGDPGPLTTMLVMDVSGSMYDAGKLVAAQAAAIAYIDQMRPGDRAGLMSFNTEVYYPQPITADRDALIAAVDGLVAQGDTSMYDTLGRAAELLQAEAGRKAIIVLTDGLDNTSRLTAQDVIGMIGPGGLSISTIGLGNPLAAGTNSGLDEAGLRSLAEQAGGMYGYASDPAALRALYESYGRALQSEYSITYTSPAELRDGVNRSLSVGLSGSGTQVESRYNPGGVIPEVASGATWPVFLSLLAGLVLILFVPLFIGLVRKKETKPKSRIKLK